MKNFFYYSCKKSFFQLTCIVLAASVAGMISNYSRTAKLPLIGDWTLEARLKSESDKQKPISLAEAKKLYESGSGAVFIDARSLDDYNKGHIKGARSLPWLQAEQLVMDVINTISNDTPVITYCDGEACKLSKELALFLENLGFTNVRVLVNGWSVWKEAGLPVEKDMKK